MNNFKEERLREYIYEYLDLLKEEGCVILIANFSGHTDRPSYRGALLLKIFYF